MNDSLRPAGRAQAGAVDRLAAGRAELRQRDVDDVPQRGAQRAADAREAPRRDLGGFDLPLHGAHAIALTHEPQPR